MTDIRAFLKATHYGVAGASVDRRKYGNKVLRALLAQGKLAIPIHPRESIIEGQTVYPTIAAAPSLESLCVITPPKVTESIIAEAIAKQISQVWIQPGAESELAITLASNAGMNVIAGGPCILVALRHGGV